MPNTSDLNDGRDCRLDSAFFHSMLGRESALVSVAPYSQSHANYPVQMKLADPWFFLGQQFALTEASYTIARLCQTFSRIETAPGEESRSWTESLNLTCAVYGGVKVRCSK